MYLLQFSSPESWILLFIPTSIISNNNTHNTISFHRTKQHSTWDTDDSVGFLIEKVEDVLLLGVTFLTTFVVGLAFADCWGVVQVFAFKESFEGFLDGTTFYVQELFAFSLDLVELSFALFLVFLYFVHVWLDLLPYSLLGKLRRLFYLADCWLSLYLGHYLFLWLLRSCLEAIHPSFSQLTAQYSLISQLPLIQKLQWNRHEPSLPILIANSHSNFFLSLGNQSPQRICKPLEIFILGIGQPNNILIIGNS